MTERKPVGGRNAYVEDRSAVEKAARDLVRGHGSQEDLNRAVNKLVQKKSGAYEATDLKRRKK